MSHTTYINSLMEKRSADFFPLLKAQLKGHDELNPDGMQSKRHTISILS